MVNILFVLFAIYSMSSGDEYPEGLPEGYDHEDGFKRGYDLLEGLLVALTDVDRYTVSRPEFTNLFSLFPAYTDKESQREINAIFDYLSKGTNDIDFGEFVSQMAQFDFADYCKPKPKPIPIEETKARLVKDFKSFFKQVRGGEGCTISPEQLRKFLEVSDVPSDMVDEKVSGLFSLLDEAADGLIEFKEGYGLLFALTDMYIEQTRTVSRQEFERIQHLHPELWFRNKPSQEEIEATFDYLSKGTDVIDFEEFKSQMRKLDFGNYCKGPSSSSGQSIMTPMFAYTSARSGTNTAEFYAFEILAFVLCVLLCISLYFNVKSMCGMNSKNYGFKKVAMDDSDRESQAFV